MTSEFSDISLALALARLARSSGKTVGQFVDDALQETPPHWFTGGAGLPKYGPEVRGLSATHMRGYGMSSALMAGGMFATLAAQRPEVVEDAGLFLSMGDEVSRFDEYVPAEASEIEMLARFCQTVSVASIYLSSAFAKAGVFDFTPPRSTPFFRPKKHVSGWYSDMINHTFAQYSDLRHALVHPWAPTADAGPLAGRAFLLLCDLTPARLQLFRLYSLDQSEAFIELARHLDVRAEQIRLAVKLAADLEEAETKEEEAANDARLVAIQDALLAQAGEMLSLTVASGRLGVTRQNLHKRIQRGSALGVLKNGEILVPTCQFVEADGKLAIVKGLRQVTEAFLESGEGHWAAMQFLIEPDPNLETTPMDALKGGRVEAVMAAAQAYLGSVETPADETEEG